MNTNFISTFQTALKRLALISIIAVLAACAGNNTSSNRSVPDGYYKVRPGDTLIQIAKRYGQNVNTLVAWNNLPNASQIEVAKYCASAIMLPPAILLRSNAKQPPLPRSTG